MLLNSDKATSVICACVYLHNYLRASNSSAHIYTPQGSLDTVTPEGTVTDGQWRKDEQGMTSYYPLPRVARKPSEFAQAVREEYATYFASDIGSVPWQKDYA